MAIKAPPVPLSTPNYVTLSAGATVHRVHLTTFSGNAFNPCQGGQTRFAPIADKSGKCVPSLYAGATVESAFYETIFHDVPAKARLKTIPKSGVVNRSHSTMTLNRKLKLVNLRAADLKKWGIKREQLIGCSAKLYGKTADWARAIHHGFSKADGLCWTSNQCDPDTAYLFFGDRVASSDLTVLSSRDGNRDPSFLVDARQAGRRGGIIITL